MYNKLYDSWKEEKDNVLIGELNRDFYSKVANYLSRIRNELEVLDENSIKANLIIREFEFAEKIIKDIIQLRYEKNINLALTLEVSPVKTLPDEEREIQESIVPLLRSYQSLLSDMLAGHLESSDKTVAKEYILVRFIDSIPAIIGSDMKTYGPFKQEDVATLPLKNANILIRRGVAVKIESE